MSPHQMLLQSLYSQKGLNFHAPLPACVDVVIDLVEGSLGLSQLHAPGREQRPGTNDGGGLPDSLPGAVPHLGIVIPNHSLKGFTFKYLGKKLSNH